VQKVEESGQIHSKAVRFSGVEPVANSCFKYFSPSGWFRATSKQAALMLT
jgi:hypothetical protein